VAIYSVEIGDYDFDIAPGLDIAAERIVRENLSPVECVAINYTFTLPCRIRSTTPAASITAFLVALNEWLETRDCPAFRLKDEGGAIVGDYEVDEERDPTLNWEDVYVAALAQPPVDGQWVSGAVFTIVIRARRSFPDANGICELEIDVDKTGDEFGNEVHRKVCRLRWAKASAVDMADASDTVKDLVRLDAPVGWAVTIGIQGLGFAYRTPLYPELHVVETVCEVRTTGGVAGGTGAIAASTGTRTTIDPAKGLRRITHSAQQDSGTDPGAWVEGAQPNAAYQLHDVSFEDGSTKRARGEWTSVEAYRAVGGGKTTDVKCVYSLRGGRRDVTAVKMTPPFRPKVQRSGFDAYRLVETVEVRALGATRLDDFAVPVPLDTPWVLGPITASLPRVEEEAVDPSQRLWVWVLEREYVWDGEGHPLEHPKLLTAVFRDSAEEGA
jgi:hypothetical protein